MLVTSIRAELSRDQATRKMRGPLREARRGRLEEVVDFYIPFRLFEVSISNASKKVESLLAVDSVTGRLDLYPFDEQPTVEQEMKVETDRVAKSALSEAQSFSVLKEKVRRRVYLKGLFRVRSFQLRARCAARLHIPYWVGVYGRGGRMNLDVIDALRGSFAGREAREMVAQWFGQHGALK
jgi:hypothetical protein